MKTTIALLILSAPMLFLAGCNTVKVQVPEGAKVTGSITVNQSIWKANALSGEKAEGRVDAVTTPTTDTSLTGL